MILATLKVWLCERNIQPGFGCYSQTAPGTGWRRLLKRFFRLHRKSNRDFGCAVENLDQLIAQQTAELAFAAATARQLDAAVAGAAIRADDVGLLHDAHMDPALSDLNTGSLSQSNDRSDAAGISPRGWSWVPVGHLRT
jgi:hypothetical protein